MKLEIKSIADAGIPFKERIVLRALKDIDIGNYAILKSGVGTNGREPTSGRKAAYWFPDEKVEAGDLVVLYTKKGSPRTKALDGGQTVYFFYWGRDEAIWTDSQSGAVLAEIADWQFTIPG